MHVFVSNGAVITGGFGGYPRHGHISQHIRIRSWVGMTATCWLLFFRDATFEHFQSK